MRAFYLIAALAIFAVSAARADDEVSTIKGTVAAVYDVISGPAGEARDWARFKSLFAEGARLITFNAESPSGMVVMTPQGYIDRAGANLEENGFFEQEIAWRTERFGNMAQVFSTYEGRRAMDDATPLLEGINSFQLVRLNGEWKVMTILWQSASDELPLPEMYR